MGLLPVRGSASLMGELKIVLSELRKLNKLSELRILSPLSSRRDPSGVLAADNPKQRATADTGRLLPR